MSLEARIEALLFASDGPLSVEAILRVVAESAEREVDAHMVKEALRLLQEEFERRRGGFHLVEVAGGYEFRTRKQFADDIRRLHDKKATRLSASAMETLAIVAYRQPCTRPLIDQLRGVDSSASLRTLLERNLVTLAGRSTMPGRPHLYRTTPHFLRVFGLSSLRDLPDATEVDQMVQGHLFQVGVEGGARPSGPQEAGDSEAEGAQG